MKNTILNKSIKGSDDSARLQAIRERSAAVLGDYPQKKEELTRQLTAAQEELRSAQTAQESAENMEDYDSAAETTRRAELRVKFADKALKNLDAAPRMHVEEYNAIVSECCDIVEKAAEDYRNKVEPLMDQLRAAKEAYLAIANDANETLIQLDAAANVLQSEYPNQIFTYTDGTIREVPDSTEWKNHAHRFEPWRACQLATETGEKARPHDSVLYAAWRAVGNAYPRKFF